MDRKPPTNRGSAPYLARSLRQMWETADLSTPLRSGRDDKVRCNCRPTFLNPIFILLGGPQAHEHSGRDDKYVFPGLKKREQALGHRETGCPRFAKLTWAHLLLRRKRREPMRMKMRAAELQRLHHQLDPVLSSRPNRNGEICGCPTSGAKARQIWGTQVLRDDFRRNARDWPPGRLNLSSVVPASFPIDIR